MIKFEELIIKWNNGTWRGAQTKFAQKIGVRPNTVSQWIKFSRPPDRDLRGIVARKLRISEEELLNSFIEHAEDVGGRKQNVKLVESGVVVSNTTMCDTGIEVSLPSSTFIKLRSCAEEAKKEINDQLVLILDEYFAKKEAPMVDDSTIVPSSTGNVTPGVQPFATSRHRRSGEGRPSGRA